MSDFSKGCYNITAEDKDNRSVIVDYVTDGYTRVTDHPTEKMDGSNICGPVFEAYDFDKDDQVDAYFNGSDVLIFNEKYRAQALETTFAKYSSGKSRVLFSTNPQKKAEAQALFDLGNNPGKNLRSEFTTKINTNALRVGAQGFGEYSNDILFTDSGHATYVVFFEQNYEGGSTGDYTKYPINGARLFSTQTLQSGYYFFGYVFGSDAIGANQRRAKELYDQKHSDRTHQ